MKAIIKPIFWTIGVLAVILLFIIFLLPGILRNVAMDKIEQATKRQASIGRITLNPFTLSARVSDFRLAEKDGSKAFVSFSSARIKISPASVTRRALIVSKLQVSAPRINLVRTSPNRYNFSDLITKKKSPEESKFLFSINNIEISNGSVDFLDRVVKKPTAHTVRRLNVAVPFVSNIPYLADIYVAPHFSADINGARFVADGKLRPLAESMETSAIISLKKLDIPHYMAYLPLSVPISFDSGRLSTTTEITYRVSAASKPEVSIRGPLKLDDIKLNDRQGKPLASLDSGLVRIRRADIVSRSFDLASLETAGLEVFLERNARGGWTWQSLLPSPEEPDTTAAKKTPKEKPRLSLKVDRIRSTGGKVHFNDRMPKGGFNTELKALDIDVKGLTTRKDGTASWNISFRSSRDESLAMHGKLTLDPLELSGEVKASGIVLESYYPYLAERIRAPLTGRLDTDATVTFASADGLLVDGFSLAAHDLAMDFGRKEGAKLAKVSLTGGALSLKEKSAEVESVILSGGDLKMSREKDGGFSYERILAPTQGKAAKPAQDASKSQPFSYRINSVEGNDLNVALTDRSRKGSPVFPLKGLRFTLGDITGPTSGSMPFTLAAGYGRRGNIAASGTVLLSPLKVRGSLELKRIPLRDFDAYLPEDLAVSLAGGAVDSRLDFTLAKPGAKMEGSFAGNLGIRSFYCLDTKMNEDLLKWERLQMSGIRGTIEPFNLKVGEVSASNFYSRLTITRDGTLNLQNLKGNRNESPAQDGAQPSPQARQPVPSRKPDIRIDAVTLQGGTMVFSDNHLVKPFSTTFYNLGGRISGLASDEKSAAQVDLRGNLESHSPLTITGTINPLRKNLFVDLKIDFSDIELAPTTPYTSTFLGYTVNKGKLYLQLAYHIEDKNLTSQNKLFFDQLEFGEKVESDKATSLPVRLAVALLKDRKGEIHLDLPVTGRTDDPEFSVWGLVFQVLKNLLVKAATSPFALLQAAFGGSEDFSGITFAPGSSQLAAAEREKLLTLAKALQDRPGLDVEVMGYVDKEKDPAGYRSEYLARKMRTEKFLALVKAKKNRPGQTPDSTAILPEEYSSYLKIVYRKEKFPKPRNFIGMVKDLPDDEMKKLIFTHTVVGDAELGKLAYERAAAVYNFLTEQGKVAKERVFLRKDDIYKLPEDKEKSGARVEFGAKVK